MVRLAVLQNQPPARVTWTDTRSEAHRSCGTGPAGPLAPPAWLGSRARAHMRVASPAVAERARQAALAADALGLLRCLVDYVWPDRIERLFAAIGAAILREARLQQNGAYSQGYARPCYTRMRRAQCSPSYML
jgi:hypothetical protein